MLFGSSFRFPGVNLQHRGFPFSSTRLRTTPMKTLLYAVLLAFAFSALAIAEDMHMKNVSTTQPAADAQLTHQKDDNGNVKVKIHFYHLARPDSLTPAKDAYVVWIEPNGQP